MAHPWRASLIARSLFIICLVTLWQAARPANAQEASTKWQPLAGPGGRLIHLVAAPDGQDVYAVSALTVNRRDDQTQWRETGASTESNALYASRDAGATWQPLTNDLPPGRITALYVDTLGRIWLGHQMRADLAERRNELWRSDDHGENWRLISLDRDDLIIRSILEAPDHHLLFGAVDVGGFEQGLVYQTADAGATWSTTRLNPSSVEGRLKQLSVHPAKADTQFIVTTAGAVLRSADRGATWQRATDAASGPQGSALLAFLPDGGDTAILVQSSLDATKIRRTTDGGVTWSEVPATGWPRGIMQLRSILALPRGVLLVNTDTGTYRSVDGGARWQPLEGALSSGAVAAWSAISIDGQNVLAATDYGLFATSDAGAVWRAYGAGLPANSRIAALLTHKDRPTLIATSLGGPDEADPPELLLTRDSGRTWLPADGGAAWSRATAWAIDPHNPDNLFVAGADYVAVSRDGGVSWRLQPANATSRTTVAVASSDSSRIYIDGAAGLRSSDGGFTWSAWQLGAPETAASGLAIDPGDAAHLWAGATDGVKESRDSGKTWQNYGLDGQAIRWLATVGGEKDQGPLTLYAGLSDGGMMRRPAAGTWQTVGAGLPVRGVITAFTADPRMPGLLWAARDGGGVYRSTDAGESWINAGMGMGDNLTLALAVNYQAPGGVLAGTASAGIWSLGSVGPLLAPTETPATGTPNGSPTSLPRSQGERTGVDARIEVLWPHGFAGIDQAQLANLGIRLFVPRSLQPPACGWRPKVQLWRALDNEPAEPVETADQRTVDGQPFPYWEANDVDVAPARDVTRKIYFLVVVEGVDTATSVWAHAADARTYLPEQVVPSGLATAVVEEVDARIQIVWPHDEQGAEAAVDRAPLANVAVTLFKHGTRLAVPPSWSGRLTLYGAWNAEVARVVSAAPLVTTRQAGVITYPVWEFNDVPVARARDAGSKLYLWAVAEGVKSYPAIWAHGVDSRTLFPAKDEPIQGCLP